jgi:branched-chain amino acid transport system substrate-binding protein
MPNRRPGMANAGPYSSTLHFLKAVHAMGPAEAKKSGAAIIAQMKRMPTDDDVHGQGIIREDGRKIHPAYLFEVKAPSESKGAYDYYKVLGTTPGDEAFRPIAAGNCSLIRS